MNLPQNVPQFPVGTIYNFYGTLLVKVEDGKAYWAIEDVHSTEWERIPDYLYETLVRFEGENK